jgi:hypothetical protein
MSTLTVDVPDTLLEPFRALAEKEFRTPEGQLLWLVKKALDAAERSTQGHLTKPRQPVDYELRLRAMQPVISELRTARLLAGAPSSRVIAKAVFKKTYVRISHTTVNGILNGTVAPSWPALEKIVRVLGADITHFQQLWITATAEAS